MNIVVTGGAGYIGSICTEEFLNAGHTVTVFDNLSEGHRSAVDPRARFVLGDLCDHAAVQGVLRQSNAEAVMHFAANALVGESMANPTKYFRNNVGGAINLFGACVALRVKKVVFSSTCATYGTPEELPITEETPQRPVNPYGESKLFCEKMLQWNHKIHGLGFVALRYFNAAGASEQFGEHHRIESHLIPNVLKVPLGQKEACEILGADYETPDGTCIRDYVHVSDIARAHLLALKPESQGFFNLGNSGGFSVREVIQTCERVVGRPIKTVERPRRPGDPARLIAASDRARTTLGWEAKFRRLEDIVADAWSWHRRHPLGYAD